MRRGFAWVGALAVAGAAAWRALRRAPAPPPDQPDPRAQELRDRIAESRELVGERDEFEQAETPVDAATPGPAAGGIDARRREVHERGRAAADELRGGERE